MLKKIAKRTLQLISNYKCPVCNKQIYGYLPLPDIYRENSVKYGYKYFGQNEHLSLDKYTCPNCSANDRDRLYASFFKDILQIKRNSNLSLLHIAPSWSLNTNFLVKYFNVTTTDLYMQNVNLKLDIENMKDIEENSFDFLICSHVLEHVKNPDIALNELLRVLKPSGQALIMVPINPNIKNTIEDSSHESKEERIKYYGQEDHLRLFAKQDFMDRIVNSGFELKTYDITNFGKRTFKRLGLRHSSVLYTGIKPYD